MCVCCYRQLTQSFSWCPCRPSQQKYEQHLSLPNQERFDQQLSDLLAWTFLSTLPQSQFTKKEQSGDKALACLDDLRQASGVLSRTFDCFYQSLLSNDDNNVKNVIREKKVYRV